MDEVTIEIGSRTDAFAIRKAVFMDEQGYENEYDAIDEDPSCIHVTLYVGGELVGCSRSFPRATERVLAQDEPESPACVFDDGATEETIYVMGRVAVLAEWRRRGLASVIVRATEDAARDAGAQVMKLHAQEYVRDMYLKLGYTQISEVDYEDEGQPHLWMAKKL